MTALTASRPKLTNPGAMRAAMALLAAGILGSLVSLKFAEAEAPKEAIVAPLSSSGRLTVEDLAAGPAAPLEATGASALQMNAAIPIGGLSPQSMNGFHVKPSQFANAERCLTQAIYYEAGFEPLEGRRAVAQVVINRVRHPSFPNSVCGVVYQGYNQSVCQFSFVCDGSLLRTPQPAAWAAAQAIARSALLGYVEPAVGSATNYHADYVVPKWAFSLSKIVKIGAHIFYRFGTSAGNARAFTAPYLALETIPKLDFVRLANADAADVQSYSSAIAVEPRADDRHAPNDVAGRIDPSKGFSLSLNTGSAYRSSLISQATTPAESKDGERLASDPAHARLSMESASERQHMP